MKVYIVTDGCYSDYTIEKVFSNRKAAEEYKKWRNITNDIEEYEVHDEPFKQEDGEKYMFIRITGIVYPEAVVDITYEIRYEVCNHNTRSNSYIMDYKRPGVYALSHYRYIPVCGMPDDPWDEEKYKAKLKKYLQDLAALTKLMFAEGASVADVEQVLRNHPIEED